MSTEANQLPAFPIFGTSPLHTHCMLLAAELLIREVAGEAQSAQKHHVPSLASLPPSATPESPDQTTFWELLRALQQTPKPIDPPAQGAAQPTRSLADRLAEVRRIARELTTRPLPHFVLSPAAGQWPKTEDDLQEAVLLARWKAIYERVLAETQEHAASAQFLDGNSCPASSPKP